MTEANVLIIVGVGGDSINRELAQVAAESSAHGIALNVFESSDLPQYSETFEDGGTPSSVGALRTAAADADAVLIVTTYRGGVSAVGHNAIDWLTRRWDQANVHDKPLAVIGPASGCYSGVWSHQTDDAHRIAGPLVIESINVSNLHEAINKLAREVHASDTLRATSALSSAQQSPR
jgi:NADPH-dependent FMN reductase